jgi:hypothetical protein
MNKALLSRRMCALGSFALAAWGCVETQPVLPRRDASPEARADVASPPPDVVMEDRAVIPEDRVVVAMDVVADRVVIAADAGPEASRDVAVADVPAVMADAGADAASVPRCTPTVDGTIGASEYNGGARVDNTVLPSAWGPNELRELRACVDDVALYLAVRGSVEGSLPGATANSVLVYIDRDFRGGSGATATGISLFSALADRSGRLDTALSSDFRLTAAVDGFGVEGAFGWWGTRTFAATTSDESQGWRLFWPAGGTPDRRRDFSYITTGVSTNCQDRAGTADDVCETSVRWVDLFEGPRPARTTIALFARVVNNDGSMSPDQGLPQDDPMNPRSVSRVLTLEVR